MDAGAIIDPQTGEVTEPSLDKIAAALAKAQGEMKNAEMNRTNPHFKSKYADFAAIRDATINALAKNGLAIVQFTRPGGNGLTLVTRLMHASGQHIDSEYPLPAAYDKPQVMGSAMTYAKRYCWSAVCGIAAEDDDDGNAASQSNGNGRATGRTAQRPTAQNGARPEPPAGRPENPDEIIPAMKEADKPDWAPWAQRIATCIDTAPSKEWLDAFIGANWKWFEQLEGYGTNGPKWHKSLMDKAKARETALLDAETSPLDGG